MKTPKVGTTAGFVLVLLFSASAANQGSIPLAKDRLTVVDANGKFVGNVIDVDVFLPGVAFTVDRTQLVLHVQVNRFQGNEFGLYFESTDCSGSPFFPDVSFVGPIPHILVWNNVVYVLDSTALPPPRTITARSILFVDAESPFCQEIDPSELTNAGQAGILIDLGRHFQPPFRLR